MTTAKEYEEAFYGACNDTFGVGGIAHTPKEVIATFEALKHHVDKIEEAGTALLQAADSGYPSAIFLHGEHIKAQDISHFRNKRDIHEFYFKTLHQAPGHEQTFLQQSIFLERTRVLHDQNSRLLFAQNKLPCSSTITGSVAVSGNSEHAATVTSNKFNGTREHEDCKNAIKEMVLRNPLEFMYIKSVKKYVQLFAAHKLCPINGISEVEKVSSVFVKLAAL